MGRCMLLLPSQCIWWAILLKGVVERMVFTYIILARTNTRARGLLYPAFAVNGAPLLPRPTLTVLIPVLLPDFHPDIHGRSYGLGR
jgi:hypothetical protein